MGAIWKTNYLQMAANFQESAEKTNQEYHLNDLLQQGVLCSSWDLPTSYLNPLLSSCPPPTPTSIGDFSSYFRENKDQHGRTPLTLLPSYRLICFYGFLMPFPFTSVEGCALLHLSWGWSCRRVPSTSGLWTHQISPFACSFSAASLLALSFLPIYLLTFLQFKQQ